MSFTLFPRTRLALALESLAGLSVGDALGARYLVPGNRPSDLLDARVPDPPWPWTDDTEQACCLVATLRDGDFDRDAFAETLGRRFDPARGYGRGAVVMLREIRAGLPWPIAAAASFDGQGSCGNGAAMRAAPLGAWHADSLARAAVQAARAAEVTHAHPEGIAGAVAVTVAAAVATAARLDGHRPGPGQLLRAAAAHTAPSVVRDALGEAAGLGRLTGAAEAAHRLGNGSRATAQDTVPFALWAADRHLDDYPAAVAACVVAGGDVDTTAAITGGVVAAYTGIGGIPGDWLTHREPLPSWLTAAVGPEDAGGGRGH
ncbi:ADP-ribosylglycohydrolase family protein [Actinoplanes teichomyceticus]|uniref:ADP-ribosylglycohydrolase n=1 Tax=Actinoplanes teichomyceticus TaxID=1867 RepID=A0A561VRJ6_ACTTI|nr:ADP-ribosylglycohydrolase family protein [Actinoplanes teichomyceticus]TWG14236.1 ADP-ribosylglycohydrolase [Actinoplanes teichomyceticus]GIF13208.1 hydrolase [Actinoplanes teichomyceticus]